MSLPRLPRPDEACLHVNAASGQIGPVSRRSVEARVSEGDVALTDHFWFEGLEGWKRLSDHPELLKDLGEPGGLPPRSPGESEDDYKDRLFGSLVQSSWDYIAEHSFASQIDEVFLGAVITSTLDVGYSLIDITSDGSNHYLRFENLDDKSRMIFRLRHLTPSLAVSRVLGQRASVIIGYGEKLGSAAKIMNAIRAEMKSGYIRNPEPGTITVDGDLASGYVYVQVDLYWNIDEVVKPDYTIDNERLSGSIDATVHALRKYLRGRFT